MRLKRNSIIKTITLCLILVVFLTSCSSEVTDEKEKQKEATTADISEESTEEKTEKTEELSSVSEDDTTEQETTEDIIESSKSDPIIIDYYNISSVKVGDYVSITGPAKLLCNDDGIIKVGGNDDGNYAHCGLEMSVRNPSKSYDTYTVRAYKVSPGEYEDVFYSHAPKDFSYEPSSVGDTQYSGCIATITGRVEKLLISEELENFYGISLGSDSVVEYLELY